MSNLKDTQDRFKVRLSTAMAMLYLNMYLQTYTKSIKYRKKCNDENLAPLSLMAAETQFSKMSEYCTENYKVMVREN